MHARGKPLGETPPVSPGEGPFRIKGNAYLGHMRWVAERFPGGTEAYLEALSPEMRAFFGQTFFAMSFFDLMPLVCVAHTCGRAVGMPFFEFVSMRSRDQAQRDLNGVYRTILKLSSARLVSARIPTLMTQYFDFAQSTVTESESHRLRFEVVGMPVMFAEWLHAAYEGFSAVIVKATGGVAPNLEAEIIQQPPIKGYEGCRMRLMIQWS